MKIRKITLLYLLLISFNSNGQSKVNDTSYIEICKKWVLTKKIRNVVEFPVKIDSTKNSLTFFQNYNCNAWSIAFFSNEIRRLGRM